MSSHQIPTENDVFRQVVSQVCDELAGLSRVLDGLPLCRDELPFEWLHQWASRLHSDLDRALIRAQPERQK